MSISNSMGVLPDKLQVALNSGDYARDFRAWIVAGMALVSFVFGTILVLDDLLATDYLTAAAIGILPCTMFVSLWFLVFKNNLVVAARLLVIGLFAVLAIILVISGGRASGPYIAVPLVILTVSIVADRTFIAITSLACMMLLIFSGWLTTQAWNFPLTIDADKFIWGMVRVSIITSVVTLVALHLYRTSTDRTQSRLNAAREREQQAACVLSGLLNKHVASKTLLFKLQQIGQLTGWWFDPATNLFHHTVESNGELHEFDLDNPHSELTGLQLSLDELRALIDNALATGEPWDQELHIENPGGQSRWYRSTGEVESDGTSVVRIVGVLQDITDIRAAQARRANSQKLEAMGTLAAGIAHEINTPIQYVADNVKFLRESFLALSGFTKATLGKIPADARGELAQFRSVMEQDIEAADLEFIFEELPQSLNDTKNGLDRIAKIVLSMKSFVHPGNRQASMADVNQAIESTLLICASSYNLIADIETRLNSSLPLVQCNVDQINQVILNLVINASDAIQDSIREGKTRRGTISLTTEYDSTHVEIGISDNGPGIPPEIQERIFEPFFTTKEVGRGTGQGLAISYDAIVNGHNGQLLCESTPGQGTKFRIRLPIISDPMVST